MYYHCRPIKYVVYGKVQPPPIELLDEFRFLYKWVGNYCGYYPQVWLSRSRQNITGIKNNRQIKKSKYVKRKRQESKISNDSVLFGFDIIKGFPISFEHWEMIMGPLFNCDKTFQDQNKSIVEFMNSILKDYKIDCEKYGYDDPEPSLRDWEKSGCNLDSYLKDYVFKEVDQVVVPSLNLKAAKKIICHDEKQKKKLRNMGFIEDRIQIRNLHNFSGF